MKVGETHAAINNKMFMRLGYINDQLYEVDLAKSEIEQKEPIIEAFLIQQYAKLRILEVYCNFFSQNYRLLTSMRRWKWIPIQCI